MTDGTHLMRRPVDGRLFLISNHLPEKLHRRYRLWGWAHLVTFFAAGALSFSLL